MPKILDQVRTALRANHYSRKTEEAYISWIKRFILYHNKRHPNEMGKEEIQQFINHLAINNNASNSTQNQALEPEAHQPLAEFRRYYSCTKELESGVR